MLQDVIRTICSPYGFVQRTVIFRKNGLQVLVEYPAQMSIQIVFVCVGGACIRSGVLSFVVLDFVCSRFDSNTSAQRAKQQLDGADIYAGCCTLKIEYAKVRGYVT